MTPANAGLLVSDSTRLLDTVRKQVDIMPKFLARVHAYIVLKDWVGAIADWTELLKLKPKHPGFTFDRANAYLHSKQFDAAITDFTYSVRHSKEFVRIRDSTLGRSKALEGKALKLVTDCKKTAETKNSVSFLITKNLAHDLKKLYSEASEDLKFVIDRCAGGERDLHVAHLKQGTHVKSPLITSLIS